MKGRLIQGGKYGELPSLTVLSFLAITIGFFHLAIHTVQGDIHLSYDDVSLTVTYLECTPRHQFVTLLPISFKYVSGQSCTIKNNHSHTTLVKQLSELI